VRVCYDSNAFPQIIRRTHSLSPEQSIIIILLAAKYSSSTLSIFLGPIMRCLAIMVAVAF
jgi:hypothetical protein